MMRGKHQRRKGLFRKGELMVLALMISSVLILFAVTGSFSVIRNTFFKKPKLAVFKTGQTVQILNNSQSEKLGKYRNWIGNITSIKGKQTKDSYVYTYRVRFENGKSVTNVSERNMKNAPSPSYHNNEPVQIAQTAETDNDGYSLVDVRGKVAYIEKVHPNYANNDGGYLYDLNFKIDGITFTNVTEKSLAALQQVALKSTNTASQNNEAIRQAFYYASKHPGTALAFPKGTFTIGSDNPEKDYQSLPSDTQLYGYETQLTVEGRVYWLGFATGEAATDGVKNFVMYGLNFTASDLTNGNQFMIMTNHGDNWQIRNNSFTMLQQKGSHIFDLGGLQNSTFDGNQFVGYAPDLTTKTEVQEGQDLHDFYAEAIQLDASDNTGGWDGDIMKRLDGQYSQHNPNKELSANITISNNSFLPYMDSSGKVIAYGGSLGQHSSEVGPIAVYGNTFTSSLVSRYPQSQSEWVMTPIHFPEASLSNVTNYNNTIN